MSYEKVLSKGIIGGAAIGAFAMGYYVVSATWRAWDRR